MGQNYFGVRRPDMIECTIMDYKWGHKVMTVRLKRENSPEIQYIKFSSVEFFAGPMMWKGADFEVLPDADCLEMLQLTGTLNDFATEKHVKTLGYKLYAVNIGEVMIQIVASKANKYSG